MSSSAVETRETLPAHVEVSDDTLSVDLADGRTIAAPLAWYPRLAHASAAERKSWRLLGGGRRVGPCCEATWPLTLSPADARQAAWGEGQPW
jgi:Protein of unknown function (DUF2442)